MPAFWKTFLSYRKGRKTYNLVVILVCVCVHECVFGNQRDVIIALPNYFFTPFVYVSAGMRYACAWVSAGCGSGQRTGVLLVLTFSLEAGFSL